MKYLLVCFACVLATAVASPVYGNNYGSVPINIGPAKAVGLYRVDRLVQAAPTASYAAPIAAPLALSAPIAHGAYGGHSAYGARSAIDGEVLSLARLALSLPTPAADLSSGYGHAASAY